jgi:2-iminoacetate synthase
MAVSFAREFRSLPLEAMLKRSLGTPSVAVRESLAKPALSLNDFAHLVSPAAGELLEAIARRSHQLTQQRFGKVIRFFAPLYLSNECINNCSYCGFSRDNPILRVTLTIEDVRRETEALVRQGFRNLLLVAGEHPRFVSNRYLAECTRALHEVVPSVSLEVGPMATDDYRPIVEAGAEGLVVYQETYDRQVYPALHTAGPKRNFEWRMETPERAYAAGFRRIGIGALYGLADWRFEALSLAAHMGYLLRNCWKAQFTISLPRLRPCAGEFQPLTHLSNRELAQLICAFRVMFPDVGLVLSTREPPELRDSLIPLGVTLISAGSHTEPGGYTGAGTDKLHQTKRGRVVPIENAPAAALTGRTQATEQFNIADARSPQEVADRVRRLGYEPVWKDWDAALAV